MASSTDDGKSLLPHQEEAVAFLSRRAGRRSLLVMGTGLGKSRVYLKVGQERGSLLWIVPSGLPAQAAAQARAFLPAGAAVLEPRTRKDFLPQCRRALDGPRPCVVVANASALPRSGDATLASSRFFDVCVVDEAHRYSTQALCSLLSYAPFTVVFGTATPRATSLRAEARRLGVQDSDAHAYLKTKQVEDALGMAAATVDYMEVPLAVDAAKYRVNVAEYMEGPYGGWQGSRCSKRAFLAGLLAAPDTSEQLIAWRLNELLASCRQPSQLAKALEGLAPELLRRFGAQRVEALSDGRTDVVRGALEAAAAAAGPSCVTLARRRLLEAHAWCHPPHMVLPEPLRPHHRVLLRTSGDCWEASEELRRAAPTARVFVLTTATASVQRGRVIQNFCCREEEVALRVLLAHVKRAQRGAPLPLKLWRPLSAALPAFLLQPRVLCADAAVDLGFNLQTTLTHIVAPRLITKRSSVEQLQGRVSRLGSAAGVRYRIVMPVARGSLEAVVRDDLLASGGAGDESGDDEREDLSDDESEESS